MHQHQYHHHHHPYLMTSTHHQRHKSLKSVSSASTCSSGTNNDQVDSNKYSEDEFAKMLNAFDSPIIQKAFKSGQITHQSSPRIPLATFSQNTRSPSSSSSSSSLKEFKQHSAAHYCTPTSASISSAQSIASDSSPLMFSRRSSLSSLSSCDVNKSIHSNYSSACSAISSGLVTPSEFATEKLNLIHQNTINNDTNTTCNESTIIEKTLILNSSGVNNTILSCSNSMNNKVVEVSQLYANDETVLYENEGESIGRKSLSELSKISEICREEDETLNSDLKSIFSLLNKNLRNRSLNEVKFTPPVKLEKRFDFEFDDGDFEPRVFVCEGEGEERCKSPASVLSVPSVVSEDQKRDLAGSYCDLLEKRFNSPANNSLNQSLGEEDLNEGEVGGFVVEKRELETVQEDRDENEDDDDGEEDDKILLEFINKMLPIVSQSNQNNRSVVTSTPSVNKIETPANTPNGSNGATKLVKCKNGIKKVPVVNMTRTSQLRAIKAQKIKKELEKSSVLYQKSAKIKK